jgi:hypothetical protein
MLGLETRNSWTPHILEGSGIPVLEFLFLPDHSPRPEDQTTFCSNLQGEINFITYYLFKKTTESLSKGCRNKPKQ